MTGMDRIATDEQFERIMRFALVNKLRGLPMRLTEPRGPMTSK